MLKNGQKKTKKADFEVVPAPDSIIASTPLTKTETCNSSTPSNKSSTPVTKRKLNFKNVSLKKKKIELEEPINLSCILEESFNRETPDLKFESEIESWIPTYNLNVNDKKIIEDTSGWLNDKIINAAQDILKTQYRILHEFVI